MRPRGGDPVAGRRPLAAQTLNVVAQPATATFFKLKVQDDALVPLGTGTARLKLEENDLNTVVVRQDGFREVRRSFPEDDKYEEYTTFLGERVAQVAALPYDANILVDGEARGLRADDTFAASVASDQANVNVSIEVAKTRTEVQAWKLLSSLVLSHFDVLENSDRETGYLRTARQLKTYGDDDVVIRTRVIVKRAGDSPLRYTVKIVSERKRVRGVSVKEDENFVPGNGG